MYQLLIKNGSVYDGTGSAPYVADIAARDGEIVAIGKLEGESERTIDAAGLAVSPGFIDLHTHSDISFLLDNTAQSKVRQGVTFELMGNCGSSFCAPLLGAAEELFRTRLAQYDRPVEVTWDDFAGYLDAVQRARPVLNLAAQVGHGTVRSCIMGLEAVPPDGAQMERMKSLVAECLDAGALGLSTGLFYAPGNYARLEEVIDLASVAARHGKLYSTHMRDEGSDTVGIFVALNEAIEIGRRTGVRVEISHVKCMGPTVWGRAADVLGLLELSLDEGIDVAGDQYPYTASSTSLTGALFPRWALEGGREPTLKRMADGAVRLRMRGGIEEIFGKGRAPESVVIARYVPEPRYEGLSLAEIAEELGCDPSEAALRLYDREEGHVIIHAIREDDMNVIASHPLISVGSDGSSLSSEGVLSAGKPHPRSYGANPRFLAEFVRKHKLVTLAEAVRKMTTLPALRLGLTRRGRIAPGFVADIVVFDPETVADTATFEAPHSYPVGIPHVAVNGVLVIEHSRFTGETPGKVVRDFAD